MQNAKTLYPSAILPCDLPTLRTRRNSAEMKPKQQAAPKRQQQAGSSNKPRSQDAPAASSTPVEMKVVAEDILFSKFAELEKMMKSIKDAKDKENVPAAAPKPRTGRGAVPKVKVAPVEELEQQLASMKLGQKEVTRGGASSKKQLGSKVPPPELSPIVPVKKTALKKVNFQHGKGAKLEEKPLPSPNQYHLRSECPGGKKCFFNHLHF